MSLLYWGCWFIFLIMVIDWQQKYLVFPKETPNSGKTRGRCGQEMEVWSGEAHKSTVRTRDAIWGWSGGWWSPGFNPRINGPCQRLCDGRRAVGRQEASTALACSGDNGNKSLVLLSLRITIVHILSGLSGLCFSKFQNLVTYITLFEPSPGKNIGVGCHVLLQGIFLTQGANLHLVHLLHWQAPPGKPDVDVKVKVLVA